MSMIDLRTGEPVTKVCCYKCGSQSELLVEEKIAVDTKLIVEKNFICVECVGGYEKIFTPQF